MSYHISVDDKKGFRVFDELIKRWQSTPRKFPYDQTEAIIPQTIIPSELRRDREQLFNFYWFTCLYMRGGIESLQVFRALIRLWRERPELFDPLYAQHLTQEELQPILVSYIGWDSHAVARYWIENCRRLMRNWDGRARLIFKGLRHYSEALRRIRNKKTNAEWYEACRVDDKGEGFMGFQPKMVSMLVYFIDWEGLLEQSFLYPTPADFHNFRLGFALQIITITPQPASVRPTEQLSKRWRDLTLRYLTARRGRVSPVELADAIWLFSLVACGNSPLTDWHERTDKNGKGMFGAGELEHSITPSFLSPKLRRRLQRSCLVCPLIQDCKLGVPAKPYYARKADRDIPFGGHLYLTPRFPIEEHLTPLSVDFLPTHSEATTAVSDTQPPLIADLDVHHPVPKPSSRFKKIGDE